jgi:type IV secretory pathway VirD2 relaxase
LRYIVRDGVGRDGQPVQAYSAETDAADVKAFDERGRNDRHQFRVIVAPEDGVELHDLRDFTRQFMKRMEGDLGTRLEWIAVDHWDTDNPHTHVVLRGKDQTGENLVIGREYISHGMRKRASELATEWLGPRTDLEIQASLHRDVTQERWTGLDRELHALAKEGVVNLVGVSGKVGDLGHRALLVGRLQRLQAMGLAAQRDPGSWELREDCQTVLKQLGERRDIIRTMQRAFGSGGREFSMVSDQSPGPVVGRIAAKGLTGELHDKPYLVIDGLDGRGHYTNLPKSTDLATLPVGGIVEVRAGVESIADRNITAIGNNGLYVRHEHLTQLRAAGRSRVDAEDIVTGHTRRLEALRHAGIVERVSDGVWRVPTDLVERGRIYDRAGLRDISLKLHSHLPIEKQVHAIGATWLDRQLLAPNTSAAAAGGFAAAARDATEARADFLVKEGLAERRNQRIVVAGSLLGKLRAREIESAAKTIAADTGLVHRPVTEGNPVSGVYRRSIMLASGRFAMLSDGLGFSLVPWRPVIEPALGRAISAIVRGSQVDWWLGRQRGIAI